MKKILIASIILGWWIGVSAQTVLYTENFESYPVNDYIVLSNQVWWNTWSNSPGSSEDARISDAYAHSPTRSIAIAGPAGSATDIILKLGDKNSGIFEVSWYMYIEADKCGYYSLQHFESPGVEYACEVFFRTDGSGELYAGSPVPFDFFYPKGAWFEVKQIINLNSDNIQLFINGNLVRSWPFSYQAGGTTGTAKLGGVEFYAAAISGSSDIPGYYVDDVQYVQSGSSTDPIIGVNPTSFTRYVNLGTSVNESMSISNSGTSPLNYNLEVFYNISDKSDQTYIPEKVKFPRSKIRPSCSVTPVSPRSASASALGSEYLHYDGENNAAISWNIVAVIT